MYFRMQQQQETKQIHCYFSYAYVIQLASKLYFNVISLIRKNRIENKRTISINNIAIDFKTSLK